MNKLEAKNKLKNNKLPERWEKIRLGEIIIENIKSRFKVEDADNSGRYPFFTSGEAILSDSNYLVDYENVFLATGGVANIKYYKGKANYSADTYCLKAKITTKYLYYFLLKNLTKINYKYFSGSGLKHLQKNDFKKEILIFPFPLPEQQKIAEILETVDETIEKTDAIIEKYKRIKQGLMQNLLTRGIDEKGQIRSEEAHKFKDSPLGRIPEEWEVVELGKITKIKRGASPRPIDNPIYFSENGKGWIRIQDVTSSCKYLVGTVQCLSKIGEQRSVSIKPGELIMSICATIGKPIILKIPACIHDGFVAFKDLSNEIDTEFLYYYLDFRKKEIEEMRQIGTQGNLNRKLVASFKVTKPPLHEQQRIASIFSQIDETIEKEQNYKEKFEKIKQGLMEDLLTGKVRVNYLLKEGAESV